MNKTDRFITYFLTTVIGIGIGTKLTSMIYEQDPNWIGYEEKVQKEYIAPFQIEFKLLDQDKNGELESILIINEESYGLKKNTLGRPILKNYYIQYPKEIEIIDY